MLEQCKEQTCHVYCKESVKLFSLQPVLEIVSW